MPVDVLRQPPKLEVSLFNTFVPSQATAPYEGIPNEHQMTFAP